MQLLSDIPSATAATLSLAVEENSCNRRAEVIKCCEVLGVEVCPPSGFLMSRPPISTLGSFATCDGFRSDPLVSSLLLYSTLTDADLVKGSNTSPTTWPTTSGSLDMVILGKCRNLDGKIKSRRSKEHKGELQLA
uniref:Uncharacterized protein n=1 Tax=Ananas comosus var. bracteatus TaxID=296719 RepID=A0A6V7Q1W6_ANACO|nr:unnamed protein product [Ananas comosus var. bracteatus]